MNNELLHDLYVGQLVVKCDTYEQGHELDLYMIDAGYMEPDSLLSIKECVTQLPYYYLCRNENYDVEYTLEAVRRRVGSTSEITHYLDFIQRLTENFRDDSLDISNNTGLMELI